jgi:hypothetical protein
MTSLRGDIPVDETSEGRGNLPLEYRPERTVFPGQEHSKTTAREVLDFGKEPHEPRGSDSFAQMGHAVFPLRQFINCPKRWWYLRFLIAEENRVHQGISVEGGGNDGGGIDGSG